MNDLENCPLCGKIPKEELAIVWCVNNKCKLYEIHIPKRLWNVRPIEDKLRQDLVIAKKEVDEVKNSHFALLREEIEGTRNSFAEAQKENKDLKTNLDKLKNDFQILTTSYTNLKNDYDSLQDELEKSKKLKKERESIVEAELSDMEKAYRYSLDDMQRRLIIAEEVLNILMSNNAKLEAVRFEEYKTIADGLKKIKIEGKH